MNNELIYKYQNLVYSIMHYFENYPNKEDLFQVGCIGIIKAYKNYNDNVGTKFSTYAYTYILGEMKKLIREDKGVKISKNITSLNLKIEKARILLSQKLMHSPSIKELSEYLEMPEYFIEESIRSNKPICSLDMPISSDNKDLYLSDVVSNNTLDINTLVALKQELSNLNEEERKLIEESINSDLTQSELADKYGMTQVQVSRKIKKIKEKVKTNLVA